MQEVNQSIYILYRYLKEFSTKGRAWDNMSTQDKAKDVYRSQGVGMIMKMSFAINRMKSTYFILLFTLLSCTSNVERSQYPIIDPTTFEEKELLLSDYVDDINFISFDTNFIFKTFGDHYIDEQNIILKTSEGITRFTSDGKFLNKIGSIGQGPNEYTEQFYRMAINPIEKKVYVYMMEKFRISTFLFDGTYIGTQELPHRIFSFPDSFIYNDGKFYFLFSLSISDLDSPQYEWAILDTCSNTPFLRISPHKVWGRVHSPLFSSNYNNQLLYWNLYNDSIYHLKKGSYEVKYLWGKGDWRFTYEDGEQRFSPLRKDCVRPYSMCETDHYIYITFFRTEDKFFCIYDKTQNKGWGASKITDDIYHMDIKFTWENYYKINGREYLSKRIFSDKLKETLYKGGTEEGRKLADKIDEEAGMMLMLVRLKNKK